MKKREKLRKKLWKKNIQNKNIVKMLKFNKIKLHILMIFNKLNTQNYHKWTLMILIKC